jgi:acetoacetate decarboxylase
MFKYWLSIVILFSAFSNALANSFENTNLSSGNLAYWQQPYKLEKNELLLVDIKSTPEALRALVPEPLKLNPGNNIRLYVGKLNIVEPGKSSYLEAGLVIPVTYYDEEYKYEKVGYYFPILYLNKVIPILGGREIYGFPKHHADIEFKRNDNSVHGIVKRNDEVIIDVKLDIEKKADLVGGEGSWEAFVYKRIPSVNLEDEYDVRQLTSVQNTNVKIHEQYFGKATLEFGSTEYDPLEQIPILEVTGGIFQIENSTMLEGKILHDYLKN